MHYESGVFSNNEKDEFIEWIRPVVKNFTDVKIINTKFHNLDPSIPIFINGQSDLDKFYSMYGFFVAEIENLDLKVKNKEKCDNAWYKVKNRVKRSLDVMNRNCIEYSGPRVQKTEGYSCRFSASYSITNYCVSYQGFAGKKQRAVEYFDYDINTDELTRVQALSETYNYYTGQWE